jgi:hypothetical protein
MKEEMTYGRLYARLREVESPGRCVLTTPARRILALAQ